MKTTLNATVIKGLKPGNYDVRDTKQPGLVLRVRESGQHSYLVSLGRGRWFTLGKVSDMVVDKARVLARATLTQQADGKDPIAEKRAGKGMTFSAFLDEKYAPWARANMKQGAETVERVRAHFGPVFGDKPLAAINGFAVERWRASRLRTKVRGKLPKPITLNRNVAILKACLSRAVEWGLLADHPLRRVKLAKTDDTGVVRFLSPAEETRLRDALAARDTKRRDERERANAWRRERGYKERPTIGTYSDHLTPVVLLALNTGLRRGELLSLAWSDVDMTRAMLAVRGTKAKSGRTRHIPLNAEAVAVLKAWNTPADGLVFPGDTEGKPLQSLKTAWLAVARTAKLDGFRFHDLRHTFASKLVQRGVDLAVIRELLGHSDFKLTLRYSHLAPDNLAAAVAKLG